MDLKDTLRDRRKRQGLSQIELAEALGISRQTVSKWETGTALPSAENLMALGKLYGVSVDALLNGAAAEPVQEAVLRSASVPAPPESRKLFRPRRLWLQILGVLLVFDSLMFWVEMASGLDRSGFLSIDNFFSPVSRWMGALLIGLFFAWRDRSTDLNRKISRLIALAALAAGLYTALLPGPWLWRLYDFVAYLGAGPSPDILKPAKNSVSLFFAWTLFDEGALISHCMLIAAFQLGRLRFSRRSAPAPRRQPVQSI